MRIKQIDHLVLTVENINKTCEFYTRALGMDVIHFGSGRIALQFGQQKINLHEQGKEFDPKAIFPQPGSADLCFLTDIPIHSVIEHLQQLQVDIIEGPVERTGATGKILSIYIRDPDQNLLEIANPLT